MLAITLFLLTVAAQAISSSPTPDQKPAEKQECQIFGDVVQRDGGEPLRKATVALQPLDHATSAKPYNQRTGEDGKFCFKDVAPGRYSLSAKRNGFVPLHYGADDAWSQGTALALEKGQKLERLILRLVRASVITGKIVDQDGDPAPAVLVQALVPPDVLEAILDTAEEDTPASKSGLQPVAMTVTNDLGEFRLPGLPGGKYFLMAADTGGRMNELNLAGNFVVDTGTEDVVTDYAPTYYPGTTRVDQAAAIEIAASEETAIEIQLQHETMVAVSGIVTREDRTPVSGAIVRLSSADESLADIINMPFAQTDGDGHFTVRHVVSGSYTAEAGTSGGDGEALVARQKIEVGKENVGNVHLVLGKGLTIIGKVTAEGGSLPKSSLVWVTVQSKGESGFASDTVKDSEIKLTGLAPGTYHVALTGLPEQYFLKRVIYGKGQSGHDTLTISSDGQPENLELLVSPHGATLEGMVQDSKEAPVGGAVVVLRAAADRDKADPFPLKKTAVSDQTGKFYFRGLPPGKYRVMAKKRSNGKSDESAQELAEGEKKSVKLVLDQ